MKKQMKFQKIVCLVNLITAAVAFFFSLGLLTDIYKLLFAVGIPGNKLYKEMQPFNKDLVRRCIIMIVLAASLFVTRTQIRRRYYISNYIMLSASALANLTFSLISIFKILGYRHRFLTEVNFELWRSRLEEMPDLPYTESTLWLDLNIAVLSLVIVASLLLVANLVWKIKMMKFEDRLLSGEIKPGDLQSEV